MFLFAEYESRFAKGELLHRFFQGQINFHLVGDSGSVLGFQEFLSLNKLDLAQKMRSPKWIDFVCTSLLNHFMTNASQKCTKMGKGNRPELEKVLTQIKLECADFQKFKKIATAYLNKEWQLRINEMPNKQNDIFLKEIWSRLHRFLGSGECSRLFRVGPASRACFYIYCLIRGVKTSKSLAFLRNFFISELSSKIKAEAFKQITNCLIFQIINN